MNCEIAMGKDRVNQGLFEVFQVQLDNNAIPI